MSNERAHRRRYGDKEVGLILRRATELQKREPTATAEGSGLTLRELVEIAAEVGIDPRHLRRAAEDLDAGAYGAHAEGFERLAGSPLTIELERTLDGEFPESGFPDLVAEIQQVADGYGQPSVLGSTLTWQSSSANDTRTLQVTINVRDGRTRIRIEERLSQLAGALFGGILGGGGGGIGLGVGLGVGLGALQSALFAIAWPIGAFGAAYLLARALLRDAVKKRQRALRGLLDRLTDEVAAATADQAIAPPRAPEKLPGDR